MKNLLFRLLLASLFVSRKLGRTRLGSWWFWHVCEPLDATLWDIYYPHWRIHP